MHTSIGASGQLNARYGEGTGSIWFDSVNCVGTEERLVDCVANSPAGNHNCGHEDDAGVLCYDSKSTLTNIRYFTCTMHAVQHVYYVQMMVALPGTYGEKSCDSCTEPLAYHFLPRYV